ncbi:hypothetical protein Droror1_Dr00015990, partial [Drosera rotundifolia]
VVVEASCYSWCFELWVLVYWVRAGGAVTSILVVGSLVRVELGGLSLVRENLLQVEQ